MNIFKRNKLKNISKAIIQVMAEVKGMEKNSTVGKGQHQYNGTKDQDVKEVFNSALVKYGLCILPTGIEEKTEVFRWEQEDFWQGQSKGVKTKQSVFTKVVTKYLLLHESGESIKLSGYGHGVDTQDKGAGKATTYALKNLLLYTFLTPVGKIEDTDNTHSNEIEEPVSKPIEKGNLTQPIVEAEAAKKTTIENLKKMYHVSLDQEIKYLKLLEDEQDPKK